MSFYKDTFEKIIDKKDNLNRIYNKISKYIPENFNYNILPKTPDTVLRLAPLFINKVGKDCDLVMSHKDYYIAFDKVDLIKYVCFKNILMIDIDNSGMSENFVITHFTSIPDKSFTIYKTTNGYHVFCTSSFFEYRDTSTVKFMLDNHCDFFYTIFSYIRGFCTRLSKKPSEKFDGPIYRHLVYIRPELADNKITELIDSIHLGVEWCVKEK